MRYQWLSIGFIALFFVVLSKPGASQDNFEQRISGLETRVSLLEGTPDATSTLGTSGHTITGSLLILANGPRVFHFDGATCAGASENFADLYAGRVLEVLNEHDDLIGTGSITEAETHFADGIPIGCEFHFTATDLPDAELYRVQMGTSGELIESAETLEKNGWRIDHVLDLR